MGHQVADQDRANRSDQISVGLENLHGAEGWNVVRQRFDQPETSFLKQGHQRRANDRLGHRIEAEDRIGGHRRPRFLVAPAERARVHDFAAAGDERIDPCINVAIDIGLHCRTDALKAPGAHSDRFRRFDCVVHGSSICGLWRRHRSKLASNASGRGRDPADLELPRPLQVVAGLDDETTRAQTSRKGLMAKRRSASFQLNQHVTMTTAM